MMTDHDTRTGERAGRRRPPLRRRWTLVLVSAAFLVVVSDSTIVYTALPSIARGLGAPPAVLHWVVVIYLLTSGGLLLLGGRLADLVGRRRVFLGGMALFTVMSLVAGSAWSPGVLIAARTVQGIGAAAMVPAALSIVTVTFPEGEERNRALGVWGALAGIGATAGLLLGGPITSLMGWRWIFLLNVPVGIVVLAVGPWSLAWLQETRGRARRFDVAGAATSTLAMLALVHAVVEVPRRGFGVWTVGPLLVAVVVGTCFVHLEAHVSDPLVPLRLFRSRFLVGGNLVILAAGMSVDGLLFTFTLVAQGPLGYSPVAFGLVTAVMTAASFVGVVAGQQLVTRLGVRPIATSGLALVAAGSLVLTRVDTATDPLGVILVGLLLFGPGMGAAFVAGQIAALTGVAPDDAGLASGVEETTFAIGSALGVAIASSVIAAAGTLEGASQAFLATALVAALGLVAGIVLLERRGHGTDAASERVRADG